MSFSNLSLSPSLNPLGSTLAPTAGSVLGPFARMSGQSPQSAASAFEAMLSSYPRGDNASDPSAPQDLLPADLRAATEELKQHPLDLLPADMKVAIQALEDMKGEIQALEQDLHSSCVTDSDAIAPALIPSSRITWNSGTLTDGELEIVAVLNRHKDVLPLVWDDPSAIAPLWRGMPHRWVTLGEKANDPSTPPDLKAALEGLRHNPELFYALGSDKDGCDGILSAKDLSGFSAHHSQVAAFQERQAQSYVQNYIPSDGTRNGQLSVMTLSDALRELYRYSESLPKNLSLWDFRQIVDGSAKTGKCPPQVIASAQYFLNHPDAWKRLYGGEIDKVHKYDFLHVASSSMSLTQTELDTLDSINKNQAAFFGEGVLTRDKLERMADDKSLGAKVQQVASQLLSDPLLFGLLNNSITGYKNHNGFFDFGGGHTVDSGDISNNDFTHFYSNMSAANRTVQQVKTHDPQTAAEHDTAADMMMGVADQPNIKSPKKNGGALMHTLDRIFEVGSTVLDWASTAVGLLSFIPGLGQLATLGSELLQLGSVAANLLHTAISGGNMKQALISAGLNLAAQLVGNIAGPQVKLAMREGLAKMLMERAVEEAVNLPISVAQHYAENALYNLKARIETESMQPAGVPS